jgi:hypothetical protein
VRLGPSTPGDYVRARVLVPQNPGVTIGCSISTYLNWPFSPSLTSGPYLSVANDLVVHGKLDQLIINVVRTFFHLSGIAYLFTISLTELLFCPCSFANQTTYQKELHSRANQTVFLTVSIFTMIWSLL